MLHYIIKRLMMVIPVFIGVAIIIFFLLQVTPGDPAKMILGPYSSEERVAELRERLGLNEPVSVQFYSYFEGILKGDLGISYVTADSVTNEILSRFAASAELALFSIIIAIIMGIIIGVMAAIRQNSVFDITCTTISVLGMSTPSFWLGLLMIYFFSIILDILPIGGRLDLGINLERYTNFYILDSIISGNFVALKNTLQHLVLPSISLALFPIAEISQMVRSTMIEILNQDFIRTARAKGLSEKKVILKHALKNVLIPVVTIAGLRFGTQFANAIIVEIIFSWPGIGRLAYDAIQARDYPLIQGVVLFMAFVFVFINLLVDIIYVYIDPRIKYV